MAENIKKKIKSDKWNKPHKKYLKKPQANVIQNQDSSKK